MLNVRQKNIYEYNYIENDKQNSENAANQNERHVSIGSVFGKDIDINNKITIKIYR